MARNMQASAMQSHKAFFVRCCPKSRSRVNTPPRSLRRSSSQNATRFAGLAFCFSSALRTQFSPIIHPTSPNPTYYLPAFISQYNANQSRQLITVRDGLGLSLNFDLFPQAIAISTEIATWQTELGFRALRGATKGTALWTPASL